MVNKPISSIVETLLATPVARDYYDLLGGAGVPDEWADVLEAAFESDVESTP